MPRKDYATIGKEIEAAKALVKMGRTYSHYKNPSHQVRVISIGLQESTEKLCVIYRDAVDENVIFVRDIDSWLEEPAKGVPRFRLMD